MALISVTDKNIYAIGISQSPGTMAPAINAQLFPNNAKLETSWINSYTPEVMTLTVGGTSYSCYPQEVSVDLDQDEGVIIEVQYCPEVMARLRTSGVKKSLMFFSGTTLEHEQLKGEYDDDFYEVLFKRVTDNYQSTGWTINGILKEIASRANVTISSLLPTFHVGNQCLIYERGESFLDFIKQLLPRGFQYVFTLLNNKLTISLIEIGNQITFLPTIHHYKVNYSVNPPYDFIEITGGKVQWGKGKVNLGGAGGRNPSTDKTQTITEQGDPQTLITEAGTETRTVNRTYTTDPYGSQLFALRSRETIQTGPFQGTTQIIKNTVETFSYENDDSTVYQKPRQTQIVTVTSLWYTEVSLSKISTGSATRWLLADSRILTQAEYNDLSDDDDTEVILSAYPVYGAAETKTETFSWVQASEMTKALPEGTQKDNTVSILQRFFEVDGTLFSALLSPKDACEKVASTLSEKTIDTLDISSIMNGLWKVSATETTTLEVLNTGSFQSRHITTTFNPATEEVDTEIQTEAINGRPPGNETRYRYERLQAVIQGSGQAPGSWNSSAGTCVPLKISIPTNNIDDFKVWGTLYWEQVCNPPKQVSMSSLTTLYPVGTQRGGVTINSYQLQQSEEGIEIVMGGIA
jgi:hypothetical protein